MLRTPIPAFLVSTKPETPKALGARTSNLRNLWRLIKLGMVVVALAVLAALALSMK